jgi:asparagine synthase (glutamine-hydrolysing)
VRKLAPGQAIIVRAGRVAESWSFYDLPYGQPPIAQNETEVARCLAEKVEEAVRRQMVSDVPIGAFLSGGLDSSAVVAMMARTSPGERFPCYSIGFGADEDTEGNPPDLPYARRVAQHLNIDLRVIEVSADMITHLGRMLYHLDEPQSDPAPINALLICERAHADGLKVLMAGAGGDDILSGYRRHWALQNEFVWSWLPQPVRGALARFARGLADGRAPGIDMHWPVARRLSKAFANADREGDERLASYFMWSTEGSQRSLYSEDTAAQLLPVETLQPLLKSLQRIPNEREPLNRLLYLETKHFLADHNLNYTDKVGMAAAVEVRVPLIDLELVSFAARIPSSMKQNGRVSKSIFKKAMEPFLPHEVIYRPKSGFGAPLRRWLRRELRPMIDDLLSPEVVRRRGIFNPQAVNRLISLDRSGRIDGTYSIFSLLCIEMWCQMFIDVPVPRPIS